jgi:uncharacterized protein (DUF1697 family)
MKTYIALFRGLNVGGHNILPMNELVSVLEKIGARSVKTYIQSGNAVFQGEETDASLLSIKIGAAIKKSHGFEPQVLLLELEEMEKAIESNPFPEAQAEPKALHLYFLDAIPENPDFDTLASIKSNRERFALKDGVFYLHEVQARCERREVTWRFGNCSKLADCMQDHGNGDAIQLSAYFVRLTLSWPTASRRSGSSPPSLDTRWSASCALSLCSSCGLSRRRSAPISNFSGQVVIGSHLLEMEYAPTRIDQIVICEVGDPVLETVGGRMKLSLGGCNGPVDLGCASGRESW